MMIDFWLRHGCRRVHSSQQGWHFMFVVSEKMSKAGMHLVKPPTCNLLFWFTYFSVSVFIDHLEWVITKNVRSNKTTLYSEQLKKKKKPLHQILKSLLYKKWQNTCELYFKQILFFWTIYIFLCFCVHSLFKISDHRECWKQQSECLFGKSQKNGKIPMSYIINRSSSSGTFPVVTETLTELLNQPTAKIECTWSADCFTADGLSTSLVVLNRKKK